MQTLQAELERSGTPPRPDVAPPEPVFYGIFKSHKIPIQV